MNKTIEKIGHILWAIFRPRSIAFFIVISFFSYWIGMFLSLFGSVLFDMYIKKRPNFPEAKALKQEMRNAYPNISKVDLSFTIGLNDLLITVETKKEGITEEEAFHLACMVRETAMTEEFQQNLFQQRGLKEENHYYNAPVIFLQIMRPKKRIGENPRPQYRFEFCYFNEIYDAGKKTSERIFEGYAVFHCIGFFDKYIEEYLAQEEAAAG